MSALRSVTDEVVRLHDFFQDWFDGHGERSLDEFANTLDDAFFIVSPRGTVADKTQIVASVESHADSGPMKIRIKNVELRRAGEGDLLVATYEEHQERPNGTVARISTVGLRADASCPGGYRWLFVHETTLWSSATRRRPRAGT